MATDLAEIVGGAIALQLLFGLPPARLGADRPGVSRRCSSCRTGVGQRRFERVIIGLLAVITVGSWPALRRRRPTPEAAAGLVPRFDGTDSFLLAAAMLGATVMPHAIYVHSALARDRHGRTDRRRARDAPETRWDVGSPSRRRGRQHRPAAARRRDPARRAGTDGLQAAHDAVADALASASRSRSPSACSRPASASTSVGGYAGATIMEGLIPRRIPAAGPARGHPDPAIILLASRADATWTLVLSQVVFRSASRSRSSPWCRSPTAPAADAAWFRPARANGDRGLAGDRRGQRTST